MPIGHIEQFFYCWPLILSLPFISGLRGRARRPKLKVKRA
uniref:Uncharacterized protein n=1 Tax=Loigolactobacillus rennini TaxID=238013 RepID=A0A1K2IA96_9LACO|nr:hypothetical protein LREN565_2261 [Loigolactobacillus rennini]